MDHNVASPLDVQVDAKTLANDAHPLSNEGKLKITWQNLNYSI